MNILEAIHQAKSKTRLKVIAEQVNNNPILFKQLITAFFNGSYRVTNKAMWPLGWCVEQNPELLNPYYKEIISLLSQTTTPVDLRRSLLRTLQFAKVPKVHQGRIIDITLKALSSPTEPIAIRVFSMTVLCNLVEEIPELKNELIPLLEQNMPYASPGFRSRAKRVLKQLR